MVPSLCYPKAEYAALLSGRLGRVAGVASADRRWMGLHS